MSAQLANDAIISEEIRVIKPSTDRREYKIIKLENELEVILVNDPEALIASASMNVKGL